jgi:hypothetical protein
MGVDWLDTVTSVVSLGGMGVDRIDSHFSRLSGGYALTGLAQSLQSFIWGVCVDWLDTVTSVVYLGCMR